MRAWILPLLLSPALLFAEALPDKAAKYHAMLLKRPQPGAIMERFTSAWLEESDLAGLLSFLAERAAKADATSEDKLLHGLFLAQQADYQGAITALQAVTKSKPDIALAWLALARAQQRLGDSDAALTSLRSIKESADAATRIAASKLQAQLEARAGNTTEALATLKALATAHPQDEDLQDEVIDLMLDEGLHTEAIEDLVALLARTKDPYQRVLRRLRLGDIYLRADRRDDALTAYGQCLTDAAQDSWVEGEVLSQIERAFRTKDDVKGLDAHLVKLREAHPQRAALAEARARVAVEQSRGDEAITLMQDTLAKNPGNARLRDSFTDMLVRLQKFDLAVEQLRPLLAKQPTDIELRVRLCTLLYQARKPGEAVKELQPLIAAEKPPEADMLRVARLLEGFEHVRDARLLLERSVDLYPYSTFAVDALATHLHANQSKVSAVELWKKLAAKATQMDDVLRVSRALSSRQEHAAALAVLRDREKEFSADPIYLSQLLIASTGAHDESGAKPWLLRLLRMAERSEPLDEALRHARNLIRDEKTRSDLIKELQARSDLSDGELCLLAQTLEANGDPEGADKALRSRPDASLPQQMLSRLYIARQDYEHAAEVLEAIAAKKPDPSLSERLVTVYQRGLKHEQALRWVAQWRQQMPGSLRPWQAQAATLMMQDKKDEALRILKQAAQKFPDDVGAKTALAEGYITNDQHADAQRIYQSLYDEADDPAAQQRWAGQLAEVAQRRQTVNELLEAFQERQRSNRTSLAPWLAIAEIHRRTNNYQGRRNALMEALRLKPSDLELQHTIARADEDQGEWRRALETLEAASKQDKTQRTKLRMAELHLRYGEEETGVALLFELSGGANMDTRDGEAMAISLMVRANWKGALKLIDPLLAHHPDDYRLRYLRTLCLIESEQNEAAIDECITLCGAQKEVLAPSNTRSATPTMIDVMEDLSERGVLITFASGISYKGAQAMRYRSELSDLGRSRQRYTYNGVSQQLQFMPPSIKDVKPMITGLLIGQRLAGPWSKEQTASMIDRLAAAGHPMPKAIEWFETSDSNRYQLKIVEARVAENLSDPFLTQLWVQQLTSSAGTAAAAQVRAQILQRLSPELRAKMSGLLDEKKPAEAPKPIELLKKAYELHKEKSPELAGAALVKLWSLDPKADPEALDKVLALEPRWSTQVSNSTPLGMVMEPLQPYQRGGQNNLRTPEGRKLRDIAKRFLDRYLAANPAMTRMMWGTAFLHEAVGDWPAFVAELERIAAAPQKSGPNFFGAFFSRGATDLRFEPITVYHVTQQASKEEGILVTNALPTNYSNNSLPPLPEADAKELTALAQKVQNPTVKLLLAWRCNDAATYEPLLKAEFESPKPRAWVLALIAHLHGIDQPEYAVQALAKLRTLISQPVMIHTIDCATIGYLQTVTKSATKLPADVLTAGRTAALALRRSAATSPRSSMETLADVMDQLDLRTEAERLRKLPQHSGISSTGSSYSRSSSITQNKADPSQIGSDLADSKKRAAALPRAVAALRLALGTLADSNNSNRTYERRNWTSALNRNAEASQQIWTELTNTEPTTLKEKHQRAVLARLFGKEPIAIPLLEDCLKLRPRDANLALELATALMTQTDGRSRARDILLAIPPGDLTSVGNSALESSYNKSIPERVAWAELATDYVKQSKGKATSQQLEWLKRITDMLVSGDYGGSKERVEHLLRIDLPEDHKPSDDEKKRRQLWDLWTAQAVEVPSLAMHTLPAMIALAKIEKQPATGIIERAQLALAQLAAERNGSYSYSSYDWSHHYNQSSSGKLAPVYQLPRALLDHAVSTKQTAEFTKTTLPMVALAYGTQQAGLLGKLAELYSCDPAKFASIAQAYEALYRSSGNSWYEPTAVLEIAAERKIRQEVFPIVESYIKAQLNQNSSPDDDEIEKFGKTQLGASPAELRATLDGVIGACLGKPQPEWKAFVAQNSLQKRSGNRSPAQRRIESAIDSLQSFGSANRVAIPIAFVAAHEAGLTANEAFSDMLYDARPTKTDDLKLWLDAFASLPCFGDLRSFDPIAVPHDLKATVFGKLVERLDDDGQDVRISLSKELETRTAFGFQLLKALFASRKPDLHTHLKGFDAEAGQLSPEQLQRALTGIRVVWSDFDTLAVKPDVSKALPNFTKALRVEQEKKLSGFLTAKTVRDASADDDAFVEFLKNTAGDYVLSDPAKAERFLLHGLKLINEAQARDDWNGGSYVNGYNDQSKTLYAVCSRVRERTNSKATSETHLIAHRIAARITSSPEGMTAMFPPLTRNDTDFNEGLHAVWAAEKGWATPRLATQRLIKLTSKALGDVPPESMLVPFMEFAPMLTPWYREILLDEATSIATEGADGGERLFATELALALRAFAKDSSAKKDLQSRFENRALHPSLRARIVGRYAQFYSADLRLAEVADYIKVMTTHLRLGLPGNTNVWKDPLQVLNRFPADSAWRAIAKPFCEAWIARAAFNTKSEKVRFKGLKPDETVCLHALETFAKVGDAGLLNAFAKAHSDTYDNLAGTRLILARHGRAKELAALMAQNDGSALNLDRGTRTGIAFDESDTAAMEFAAKTITDPSLSLMTQAQIASVRNVTANSALVEQRTQMKKVAEQMLAMKDMKPLMRSAVEKLCLESLDTVRLLAPGWLKSNSITADIDEAIKRDRREKIKRPALMALARLIDGDDAPWKAVVKHMGTLRSDENYRHHLNDLCYALSIAAGWHFNAHGAESATWMPRLLADYATMCPTDLKKEPVGPDMQHTFYAYSLATDGGKAYAAWLAKLTKPQQEFFVKQESIWAIWGLDNIPLAKDADGVETLLTALKSEQGAMLTVEQDSDRYRTRPSMRYTDESLRKHTAELFALPTERRGLMLTVMNAWTQEPDLSPLVKALENYPASDFQKALIQCIRDEAKRRAKAK